MYYVTVFFADTTKEPELYGPFKDYLISREWCIEKSPDGLFKGHDIMAMIALKPRKP